MIAEQRDDLPVAPFQQSLWSKHPQYSTTFGFTLETDRIIEPQGIGAGTEATSNALHAASRQGDF